MRCGLPAVDCVADHWCPLLDGRKERAGWRARCPVCHTQRALSLTVERGRVLWNCHHAPACDRQAIRAELARLLPGCIASGRKMHPATTAAIETLLTDKTLPPTALRVAGLLELGWSAERIRAELKMPRSTWSDAVRILGQRPRSASPTSVRKLGHAQDEPVSENSDSTAGHRVTNRTIEQLDTNCYSDPAGRRHVGVVI